VKVVAINEPFMKLNEMAWMFQVDSVHGKFNGIVEEKDGKLIINGQAITIFSEKGSLILFCVFLAFEVFVLADPGAIAWGSAQADYIVESTGVFTSTAKASAHLKGGAKKVFILCDSGFC
jgi:glyceraldehyde 3-phosphate dehydrogenase